MKRRIKIRKQGFVGNTSDNNLAKFPPNWSRGSRIGVQNACTTRPNFHIEKGEGGGGGVAGKIELTAMRLAAPRRQANKVLIDKESISFLEQ